MKRKYWNIIILIVLLLAIILIPITAGLSFVGTLVIFWGIYAYKKIHNESDNVSNATIDDLDNIFNEIHNIGNIFN